MALQSWCAPSIPSVVIVGHCSLLVAPDMMADGRGNDPILRFFRAAQTECTEQRTLLHKIMAVVRSRLCPAVLDRTALIQNSGSVRNCDQGRDISHVRHGCASATRPDFSIGGSGACLDLLSDRMICTQRRQRNIQATL
jgi:hypothetical protein